MTSISFKGKPLQVVCLRATIGLGAAEKAAAATMARATRAFHIGNSPPDKASRRAWPRQV
jgi:hypothetical protein